MKPKRLCDRCGKPLCYYNLGTHCFHCHEPFEHWQVRPIKFNPHALTWPWDAEDDSYSLMESIIERSNYHTTAAIPVYPRGRH